MRSTLFLNASFQLAVAVLLAAAPFISAIPNPSQPLQRGLNSRQTAITIVPEVGTSYFLGCFIDNNDARTLPVKTYDTGGHLGFTVGVCVDACKRLNHLVAAMEFGNECWCGDKIENYAEPIDQSNCSMPCEGDESQNCGGTHAMVVYWQPPE